MLDSDWIAVIGILVTVVLAIVPVMLKLNGTVVRLNEMIQKLIDDGQRRENDIRELFRRSEDHDVAIAQHDVEIASLKGEHNRIHALDGMKIKQ